LTVLKGVVGQRDDIVGDKAVAALETKVKGIGMRRCEGAVGGEQQQPRHSGGRS
jgi:hypothetical protein